MTPNDPSYGKIANAANAAEDRAEKLRRDASKASSHVREDINALKSDVIELGRQVRDEGMKVLDEVASTVRAKAEDAKDLGANELSKIQGYVRNNPGQSVVAAFFAGAALTYIMRTKKG